MARSETVNGRRSRKRRLTNSSIRLLRSSFETLGQRTAGSVAAALLAVQNGASLVHVHDARETVDAIKVWMELR